MRNLVPVIRALPIFLITAALCLGDDLPPPHPLAAGEERLDVSRVWSDSGGRIVSQQSVGGTKVLHGLQASVGANNWLQEIAVYNAGALEQRCQFYPNGRTFREQLREHNGDGQEVIYTPQRTKLLANKVIVANGVDIGPIKIQDIICQGQIKADTRWSGSFLVPIMDGFTRKLALQEYRDGKLISSAPFPVDKLGLANEHADVRHWLWEFPDWPTTQGKRN